jgi:lysophospholipase L1-like esterase
MSNLTLARRICLALCLLFFLAACRQHPKLPALPADGVVLAFGDSLTFGTGATAEESYPAILSTLIGRRVVNAGVPGEVSAEGLTRLPRVLEETRPALMILCLGGNDFLRRLDERRVRDNLRAMVRLARSEGVEVVLIAVPKLGFGLQIPDFFRQMAEKEEILLDEKSLERVFSDAALKSDPIHPNAAGYRQIAESLARLLRSNGAL